MQYIFYLYLIGWIFLMTIVIGEVLATKLSDTHWFSKFWRSNIIGIAPKDTDI